MFLYARTILSTIRYLQVSQNSNVSAIRKFTTSTSLWSTDLFRTAESKVWWSTLTYSPHETLISRGPWRGGIGGGFSVNNATLNRFFSLHYLLPFILAALAAMHLLALHEHGSSNPLGLSGNTDRLPFHPYFTFKDLVTIFLFLLVLGLMVFYAPNYLGHSDNYIPANPMQTPPSIVPEWYLLPFYAILRSIPNKLLGVLAMFASLLILLAMPIVDTSRVRGSQFRPLMRWAFWLFVSNFFVLMYIGSQHVEEPFITVGAISTAFYFAWFLIVVPVVGVVENTLLDIATESKS